MRFVIVTLLFLSMTACGPTTPKKTGATTSLTPESMVAQIRSAGLLGNDLTVAPLRDPQVEDLRKEIQKQEQDYHKLVSRVLWSGCNQMSYL